MMNSKESELFYKNVRLLIKAMKLINQLQDENSKLQKENEQLSKRINNMYWHNMNCPTHDPGDIIFPNTDERGLSEGDTPNDLSPLDL